MVDEQELVRLYSQAVLYLYTSPEEDFGMGVIEAMAAGTPVVAWNNAGPTMTVLQGKTGYLADSGNMDDWVNRVSQILVDPQKTARFGRAGWQRSKLFSYKIHNQKLIKALTVVTK